MFQTCTVITFTIASNRSPDEFHALGYRSDADSLPAIARIYDRVHCTEADFNNGVSLFDCATTGDGSGCTNMEAALVACKSPPFSERASKFCIMCGNQLRVVGAINHNMNLVVVLSLYVKTVSPLTQLFKCIRS